MFVRVNNRIGLDGATFGELDMALGAKTFLNLKKEMNYPIFAGNVVDEKSGRPLFQGSKILDIEGYKVGVMGIVSADFTYVKTAVPHQGMKILPPGDWAKTQSRKLKKECDFIIALAHLNKEELKDAASKAGPLSFILAGHNTSLFTQDVQELSRTPVFHLQDRGKELGILRIGLSGDDFKFDNRSESVNIKNRIRFYEKTLEDFHAEMKGQAPEAYYQGKPAALNRYNGYVKRLEKDRKALGKLARDGSWYEYETVKLSKDVNEDMQVNGWTTWFATHYPGGN